MGTPKLVKEILNDINETKLRLYEMGLLIEESGISLKCVGKNRYEISYSTKASEGNIVYDNNIKGSELIIKLLGLRQYSLLLYDKSMIQAEYIVENDMVIKERLVFYKKHNKIWSKEEISEYEAEVDLLYEDWFESEIGVPIIFRVDYAPEDHLECDHPSSHFHLSNHECCRIPMKGIVSFSEFIRFVLFNFYDKKLVMSKHVYFDETITDSEKNMMHLSWN